jgi:hypothetical protein
MRRGGLHYYSTTPPLRGTPPQAGGEFYFAAPLLLKEGWRVATGWLDLRL